MNNKWIILIGIAFVYLWLESRKRANAVLAAQTLAGLKSGQTLMELQAKLMAMGYTQAQAANATANVSTSTGAVKTNGVTTNNAGPTPNPKGQTIALLNRNGAILQDLGPNGFTNFTGGLSEGNFTFGGEVRPFIESFDLIIPTGTTAGFGTGDFTVEMFLAHVEAEGYQNILKWKGFQLAMTGVYALMLDDIYAGGATIYPPFTYVISSETATHLAVSRANNTLRIFINGRVIYSQADHYVDYNTGGENSIILGGPGYLNYNSIRLIKGEGIYTRPFIAPITPLPVY